VLFLNAYRRGEGIQNADCGCVGREGRKVEKEDREFLEIYEATALFEVKKSGKFSLITIGKLIRQNRAARTGCNPAIEAISIPAKTEVKFRVSKSVKEAVL
jgi:nucleoid DNA-binding protein